MLRALTLQFLDYDMLLSPATRTPPPHTPHPCSPRTLLTASSPTCIWLPLAILVSGQKSFPPSLNGRPPPLLLALFSSAIVCFFSFSTVLLTLKSSGSLVYLVTTCHPPPAYMLREQSLCISRSPPHPQPTEIVPGTQCAWMYKLITHRPWKKLPQNISSRIESTVEWRGPQKTQILELVNDFLLHRNKVFCNPFSLSPPSLFLIPSLLSSPLLPFSYFLSLSPYLFVTYTNTHTQSQTGSHKPWVASEEHTEAGRKGKPGKASRKLQ